MKYRSGKYINGFTLIEVVLAISILAVILSITYGALFQIIRAKNLLEDRGDLESIGYAVVNRISRELQLASGIIPLIPENGYNSPPNSNIFLVGEDVALNGEMRADKIRFMALEGGQYLPDGGTHSGTVAITYRAAEDPEQKNSQAPTMVLVREEVPNIKPLDKAYSKAMIFPITNRLVSLKFRYYDKRQESWFENWGKEGREYLPSKIQFSVMLRSPKGVDKEYTTTVALRQVR